MAELTWENGQLAMYGLSPPRVLKKPAARWEKPRAADTLQSVVDQATSLPHAKSAANKLVSWLDQDRASVNKAAAAAAATASMDALVPCNNGSIRRNDNQENNPTQVPGIGACAVGSCSGAATTDGGGLSRAGRSFCKSYASASVSPSDSLQVTLDSCEGGGLTSTSLWSLENTSSGEDYTKTSGEDHDTVCHSRPQACYTSLLFLHALCQDSLLMDSYLFI